ncbi:hypothetical protein Tco_0674180 [Tanacetum coccineum]
MRTPVWYHSGCKEVNKTENIKMMILDQWEITLMFEGGAEQCVGCDQYDAKHSEGNAIKGLSAKKTTRYNPKGFFKVIDSQSKEMCRWFCCMAKESKLFWIPNGT